MNPLRSVYWWLFSYFHPALRILRLEPHVKSLLDVGCGRGLPVKMLRINYKVGVDIDLSSLKSCLKEKTHHNVLLDSATRLPFRDKSFDATLCLQVLHLLPKQDGWRAIEEMERVTRRLIVLGMPVGFIPEGIKDSWKSIWYPDELTAKGYQVRVYGFRPLHRLALRKSGTFCPSSSSQSIHS